MSGKPGMVGRVGTMVGRVGRVGRVGTAVGNVGSDGSPGIAPVRVPVMHPNAQRMTPRGLYKKLAQAQN